MTVRLNINFIPEVAIADIRNLIYQIADQARNDVLILTKSQ